MPHQLRRALCQPLAALLLLLYAMPMSYAEDSYAAEGERRAQGAGSALLGQLAPALSLTTLEGETLDLGQLYGKKPIYVKFWATWCVPCRQQMPGFEAIHKQFADQITTIAVNTGFSDDAAAVRAYRQQHGLSMPIVIDDGRLASALHMRVTPQHVVIGRDGRIMHVGHLDNAALHAALQQAVNDRGANPFALKPAPSVPPLQVGDKVTGLAVTRLDGAHIALADPAQSKPRALVFFAPWCESYLADSRPQTAQACALVRKEVDRLQVMHPNIEWLGISSGLWASAADLRDYQASVNTRLPLALNEDDALFHRFAIRAIPSVVLIDAQGQIQQILGPQDKDLARAIGRLAAK
ncbi:MAG: TlpA family protein disulfide reductase [Aeromonas sp.]